VKSLRVLFLFLLPAGELLLLISFCPFHVLSLVLGFDLHVVDLYVELVSAPFELLLDLG
jgi:hypothetical protein